MTINSIPQQHTKWEKGDCFRDNISTIFEDLSVIVNTYKSHLEGMAKEHTRQLSEERIRRQKLFENCSEAYVFHETVVNGRNYTGGSSVIVEVNTAFERLIGKKTKNLLGKTLSSILPGDDHLWESVIGTTHCSHKPVRFCFKLPDSSFYYEVTNVAVGSNRMCCIIKDISTQVVAEKKVADLEKKLHQASKMEAIGTLAGGISHDFNNVLSAVLGWAALLKIDMDEQHPSQEKVDRIIKAGKRARDLVQHILSYSRRSKQISIPFVVDNVVREALTLLQATIPRSIDIKSEVNSSGCCLLGDPIHLHQLVINCCTNAFQAIENEKGTINVSVSYYSRSQSERHGQAVLPAGKYVLLRIADNGCGISPDNIEKIFDPFFTTKDEGKGTGMGLSVVKEIVSSYEGIIDFESRLNHGTVISIYLPVYNGVRGLPEKVEKWEDQKGDARILVVDDEQEITNIIKFNLERLGYRITVSSCGKEALRRFEKDPDFFDLVITDQTMPELNGDQLAESLLAIRPEIPVILCTGYSSQIDEEAALRLGIRAYLTKPVSFKALVSVIRDSLQNRDEENSA